MRSGNLGTGTVLQDTDQGILEQEQFSSIHIREPWNRSSPVNRSESSGNLGTGTVIPGYRSEISGNPGTDPRDQGTLEQE